MALVEEGVDLEREHLVLDHGMDGLHDALGHVDVEAGLLASSALGLGEGGVGEEE